MGVDIPYPCTDGHESLKFIHRPNHSSDHITSDVFENQDDEFHLRLEAENENLRKELEALRRQQVEPSP